MGPELLATKAMKNKGMTAVAGGGALAGIFSALMPGVIIQEGQVGIKTRFGRAYRKGWLSRLFNKEGTPYGTLEAGFHLVPSTAIKKLSIKDETTDLKPITIDSHEKRLHIAEASLLWSVLPSGENATKAYCKLKEGEDFHKAIKGIGTAAVREALDGSPENSIKNSEIVDSTVKSLCCDALQDYGVAIKRVNLEEAARAPVQVLVDKDNNGSLEPLAETAALASAAGVEGLNSVVPLTRDRVEGAAAPQ